MDETKIAIQAARDAGKVVMQYFNEGFSVETKTDNTPVTQADLAANEIILNALSQNFAHPILSEETEDDLSRLGSQFVWAVDPIDGTRHFIRHTNQFAIHIGLIKDHKPFIGVVYKPVDNILYFAEVGKGAFMDDGKGAKPILVSKRKTVDSLHLVRSGSVRPKREQNFFSLFSDGHDHRSGGVGVKMCFVAEGQYDVYMDNSLFLSEWDTCAPACIVTEAGGIMTDVYGKTIQYNQEKVKHDKGVLVSNGGCHECVIKMFEETMVIC